MKDKERILVLWLVTNLQKLLNLSLSLEKLMSFTGKYIKARLKVKLAVLVVGCKSIALEVAGTNTEKAFDKKVMNKRALQKFVSYLIEQARTFLGNNSKSIGWIRMMK